MKDKKIIIQLTGPRSGLYIKDWVKTISQITLTLDPEESVGFRYREDASYDLDKNLNTLRDLLDEKDYTHRLAVRVIEVYPL